MHIVIMGCGRVGSTLARDLEHLGHSVAIIDRNPAAFRRLGQDFAGEQITGNGFDRKTLAEAGIERASAMAAVSSGDNSNIIAARVARETFGVSHVVARIYDPKRAAVYARLGIPTIATVPWTSQQMLRAVLGDQETEEWRDPTGQIAMMQAPLHASWVGHEVAELDQATGARTACIGRFGQAILPTPATVLQEGDVIHLLVTDELATPATAMVAGGQERRS